MTLSLLIYVLSLLKPVIVLSIIFTIFWCIIAVAAFIVSSDDSFEDATREGWKPWTKTAPVMSALALSIAVFTPNQQTAWMMVGGYVAQNVYESEYTEKLKKIVNLKLDEIIEDYTKEKK